LANKPVENRINYEGEYFTLIPVQDAAFGVTCASNFSYSLDEGKTWTQLEGGTFETTYTPTVESGQKIMFKGTPTTILANAGIGTFSCGTLFIAQGNIMSLLFGDDFKGKKSLSGKNYAFYWLFRNS
jgi:hypothetical protein